MAAGISVRRENVDEFRVRFSACVDELANPDDLEPRLEMDAEVSLAELDFTLLDAYGLMEPFGSCNPEPVLIAKGVTSAGPARVLSDRHYKIRFLQDGACTDAVYFDGVNECGGELPPAPWDVAFTIHRNSFRGNVSLQMIVKAIRSHEP